MNIEHNILPTSKRRVSNANAIVDLYPLASELFQELQSAGIIDRMKHTKQLGQIKGKKSLLKTRYDYVILQLHLNQLVRKTEQRPKEINIQRNLELTYSNVIQASEFISNFEYTEDKPPTIADILQLLIIAYNIGHFYNTFNASRATVLLANNNPNFKRLIVDSSSDTRVSICVNDIINSKNYHRLHIINSILFLERCDLSKFSVRLTKEILVSYLNENNLPNTSKLKYIFELYRGIRHISFISYDLQIAPTPITVDVCDSKSMRWLLNEVLSKYNNSTSSNQLLISLSKLLSDTVYDENVDAISYYQSSKNMIKEVLSEGLDNKDYFRDYLLPSNSNFNRSRGLKRAYSHDNILKLTFDKCDRFSTLDFFEDIEKTNGIRVGYYDRYTGEVTVLISLKNNCKNTRKEVAFRVLKKCISFFQFLKLEAKDTRYLLATKFFLFHLFNENNLIIHPTIHPQVCLCCTRGKKQRVSALEQLINNSNADQDQIHEVEFIKNILSQDNLNDVTISVPASIVLYDAAQKLCEFDGLVIYPNRKEKQVVFFEAKNRFNYPSEAKKCLSKKMKKLSIPHIGSDFIQVGCDTYFHYTIN